MHSRLSAGLALFATAFTAQAQQETGDTGWVARSNAHAQVLLDTASFRTEPVSVHDAPHRRSR